MYFLQEIVIFTYLSYSLFQHVFLLSFRNFVKLCYMWCVKILSYQEKWASKPILAKNCTVRVCQVFSNVLAFLPFFVPSSLEKSRSRKSPCLVSFGSLLLCWSNWFHWQVYHFGFFSRQSKKQPCAGHMTSTWPRWLLCKSHLAKFKFSIFLVR